MTNKKNNTGLFVLIFIVGVIVGSVGTAFTMSQVFGFKAGGADDTVIETVVDTVNDETDEMTADDPIPTDETDLVVIKVNDAEVTMQEVNIYMYQLRDFYTAQYGEAPWDEIVAEPDVTVRDYAKEELKKGLIRTEVLISKAKDYDVKLSNEENQACADEAKKYIQSIGPVICQDFGLSEGAVAIVNEKEYLSTKVYNAALEELAATMDNPSDAELAEAFEAMYEEWLKEYTITEDEAWANIVMGSVG